MEQEAIINWIGQHLWTVIVVVSIFIQITPIKWNPISSLIKWIGNIITADVKKDIKKIQLTVEEQGKMIEENEKDRIRWEILDFANSCRNGRKHTKDEFQHIITLNDKYKALLEKTKDKNGVFEAEYKYILYLYNKRLEKNDFLAEGYNS